MSDSNDVLVRPYQKGDEERIVPFLEMYMGWRSPRGVKPEDHWLWKYLENPVSLAAVCIAEHGGNLVSAAASIPTEIKIGQEIVLAAQGTDMCTSPDFRGKGLIGKVSDCRDQIKENRGMEMDYGFPNKASSHVSLNKRGFEAAPLNFMQYRYIINLEEFFQGSIGKAKRLAYSAVKAVKRASVSTDIEILEIESFGREFDELFDECSAYFDVIPVRSSRYLCWRYKDSRAGNFKAYSAKRNGELCGYAVIGRRGNDASIADLLVKPGDIKALDSLIAQSLKYADESKVCSLLCLLPDNHPYSRRFLAGGFLPEERYTGEIEMSFIWKSLKLSGDAVRILKDEKSKCHITLGDTDWI